MSSLSAEALKNKRAGKCPRCGRQTHKIMLGGMKKVPLTNEFVKKGKCMNPECLQPLPAPSKSSNHPAETMHMPQAAMAETPRLHVDPYPPPRKDPVPKYVESWNRQEPTERNSNYCDQNTTVSDEISEITMLTKDRRSSVGGGVAVQQTKREIQNGNNVDGNFNKYDRIQEGKIRIEEPVHRASTNRKVGLLDGNRRGGQRNSALRNSMRDDVITGTNEISNEERYAKVNEGKIKIEQPVNRASNRKFGLLDGNRRARSQLAQETISNNQQVDEGDFDKYDRIQEGKIMIEEPVARTERKVGLMDGNRRSRNQVAEEPSNNRQQQRRSVNAKYRESDSEPPVEDLNRIHSSPRKSNAPTVSRRSDGIMASKRAAASRPRASVPGVVRESGPSSARVRKVQNENGSSSARVRKIQNERRIAPKPRVTATKVPDKSNDEVPEHVLNIIKQLKTTTDVPDIVNVMDKNLNQPSIQEVGCMKFRNLSAYPDYVSGIKDIRGIEIITRAMEKHDHVGVQEQACAALWCLSTQNAENKEEILEEGGVALILGAMNKNTHEVCLNTWACGALYSLSFDQNTKLVIGSSEGVKTILWAMKNHPGQIGLQEIASLALSVLCHSSKENIEVLVSNDGIEIMLNAMKMHKTNKLQVSGCKLLSYVASDRTINLGRYMKEDWNILIDALLEVGSEVENAKAILAIFICAISDHRTKQSICKIQRLIEVFVDLMQGYEENSYIQENCLAILSQVSVVNCSLFKDTAAIEVISASLSSRSAGMSLYLDATSTLLNLIRSDDSASSAFVSIGGLKSILQLFRKPLSTQVQQNIAIILSSLLREQKNIDEFLSSNGFKIISRVMEEKVDDENLQTSFLVILYCISVTPKGRDVILKNNLICDVANTMRNFHSNKIIQEVSSNIIWHLSSNIDETADESCEVEAIATLFQVATSTNSSQIEASKAACAVLWNLSQNVHVREELMMLDGVDAFLNVVAASRNDTEMQLKAIGILSNMCMEKCNADKIRQVNGIRTIIRAANNHSYKPLIQEMVCVCLRNIAVSGSENIDAICKQGGAEVVVNAILKNKQEKVRSSACGCLRALSTTSSKEIKSGIVQAGGIDALMDIMDEHPDNEGLQAEACGTIPYLSGAADFQIVLVPRTSVGN